MRVLPDNMARKRHHKTLSLLITTLLCMFFHLTLVSSDALALLNFKASLRNDTALASWRKGPTPPCKANKANWVGIHCWQGKVRGLKLENMGLHGAVDVDSLLSLSSLRSISVMNNKLSGPLPEVRKLGALKSVYLSNNNFSGLVESDSFTGMAWLKKLHLANNHLTGNIPSSLTSLPKLLELRLEGNQFVGRIPDFQQKSFRSFNVSNNYLSGSIPPNLSRINASSFSGNDELCGYPLGQCKQTSVLSVVVVVIVLGLAIVSIGAVFFILNHRNQPPSSSVESPLPISNLQKRAGIKESDNQSRQGSPDHPGGGKAETPKLSFVRGDRERFDMQDLLKSSAEILGSGCFESSYKACLPSGQVMVVKRFKQMNNVGKEEFQDYMKRLGKLRHPNLLPLVAYYYRKEEKLLVSDYVHKGSLAVHLHGHQGLGLPSLDWATRLKIVKGIAKGLKHIYNELPSLIAPHGHLKSSNVLLDESLKPLLTDYSLIPVMNQEHAHELMVAYKSPEYTQHGRITKKTDVWSLGILILEILTGKFPASILQQGRGNIEEESPFSWVTMVVPEGWTDIDEVFDKEMAAGSKSSEGEMRKLLRIGLACCEGDVEKRWDFKEAFERIEELRENDGDDDFYTSYASEADIDSSRRISADFNLSTTGSVQIF